MQVLPVLDLLNGVVVHGVAGRRSEYRPLRSCLTASICPLDVARALRSAFGFSRFYVADLDGILHRRPNEAVYRQLRDDGFEMLVDAGVREANEARAIRDLGCEVIVGLESCLSPARLTQMVTVCGEVTFSLDLRDGRPLLAEKAVDWSHDPHEIVRQIMAGGVRRIIVLDLADVGTGSGGRTDALCRTLLAESPSLHLACGGGVRGIDDLRRWSRLGARQVLVASALHDGRLTAANLAEFLAE